MWLVLYGEKTAKHRNSENRPTFSTNAFTPMLKHRESVIGYFNAVRQRQAQNWTHRMVWIVAMPLSMVSGVAMRS